MPTNKKILEMDNISKSYPGVKALSNVSFSLKKGEVMGLVGENGAGKSTLMKVLLGMVLKDEGNIRFKGDLFNPKVPHDALEMGISMIHQEISLIPTMNVGENIWIGREEKFNRFGYINIKKRNKMATDLLESLNITTIKPNDMVNLLSVANMQLVEIARALSYNSEVIIMDEPTSTLTDVEIKLLYKIIESLKGKGVSVIFISHKLEEVMSICDRMTVLRDGQLIGVLNREEAKIDILIQMMIGRELTTMYPPLIDKRGDIILEVKNLCSKGVFHDVSFNVRRGEVLGVCGLIGAGRTEIMKAVFGADKYESGDIFIDGVRLKIDRPSVAVKNGLAMVNEDRHSAGIFKILSVKVNISIAYLKKITKIGFVKRSKEKYDVNHMVKALSIKMGNVSQEIASLSGGNQQKAIIARWLLTNPRIIILDEPTRGIDVLSKYEIYKLINTFAEQGIAVILISSELPEIINMSHRIIVIRNGAIVSECHRTNFNEEEVMKDAFGVKKNKKMESENG